MDPGCNSKGPGQNQYCEHRDMKHISITASGALVNIGSKQPDNVNAELMQDAPVCARQASREQGEGGQGKKYQKRQAKTV